MKHFHSKWIHFRKSKIKNVGFGQGIIRIWKFEWNWKPWVFIFTLSSIIYYYGSTYFSFFVFFFDLVYFVYFIWIFAGRWCENMDFPFLFSAIGCAYTVARVLSHWILCDNGICSTTLHWTGFCIREKTHCQGEICITVWIFCIRIVQMEINSNFQISLLFQHSAISSSVVTDSL